MLLRFRYKEHKILGIENFFKYLILDVMLEAPNLHTKTLQEVLMPQYKKFFEFSRKIPLNFTLSAEKLFESSKYLNVSQVEMLRLAFNHNNQIEQLCSKNIAPIRYVDLSTTLFVGEEAQKYLKDLKTFSNQFYTDYIHLSEFEKIYGSIDDYYKELVGKRGVCRCCGIERILTKGNKPRDAFDHYLPKSIYPYVSLSFKNLIPSCYHCNSSYKHEEDTLFVANNGIDTQVKAFYPFTDGIDDCNHIDVTIHLVHPYDKSKLFADDLILQFTCAGHEEEVLTWKRVYQIEERYKSFCEDDDLQIKVNEWVERYSWDKDYIESLLDECDSSPYYQGNFLIAALVRGILESLNR